jgi:hypothetical protein
MATKQNDSSGQLKYNVADDVLRDFHACTSVVRGIRAARGTSKSTACQIELYKRAIEMPPQRDGVRRSRFLITRGVYGDLYDTAVKTYIERFNNVYGFLPIKGNAPWYGGISMPLRDGTKVESEWVFKAFAEEDLNKLGSDQYTGGYVNEIIDYQSPSIVTSVLGSCARYPSLDNFPEALLSASRLAGKPVYDGFIIFDTNGPYESHWLRGFEDEPPQTWSVFVQEAPLLVTDGAAPEGTAQQVTWRGKTYYPNPKATYVFIQPKGYQYWLDMVPAAEDWYIESRILGQYSKSVSGKVVYNEFDEREHISKGHLPLSLADKRRVVCGVDTSGSHPAAVWTVMVAGTLYALEEAGAQDITYEQFVEDILVPIHNANYRDCDVVYKVDPSNPKNGIDGRTALQVMLKAGLKASLQNIGNNKFGIRRDSVKKLLNRKNGFVSSASNSVLNSGFRGHYRYEPVRGKSGIFKDSPNKDVVQADYHDALQYAALEYMSPSDDNKEPPKRFGVTARRAA